MDGSSGASPIPSEIVESFAKRIESYFFRGNAGLRSDPLPVSRSSRPVYRPPTNSESVPMYAGGARFAR